MRDHAKRTTKKFKPLAERLDTECAALPQSALPPLTEGYQTFQNQIVPVADNVSNFAELL